MISLSTVISVGFKMINILWSPIKFVLSVCYNYFTSFNLVIDCKDTRIEKIVARTDKSYKPKVWKLKPTFKYKCIIPKRFWKKLLEEMHSFDGNFNSVGSFSFSLDNYDSDKKLLNTLKSKGIINLGDESFCYHYVNSSRSSKVEVFFTPSFKNNVKVRNE